MAFWSKPKPRIHTNAPRHWPVVQPIEWDVPGLSLITIGAQLAQLHAPPAKNLAFVRYFLYEDGILQVPLVVEEEGVRTCVFLYSPADKDAAAHYSSVRSLLRSRENAAAVYYGPEPLGPAAPGRVLRPIDISMFTKPSSPATDAEFALWWATPEDPRFSESPDRALLDRWFEAIDGYGFVILTGFVNELGLTEKKGDVYALPAQSLIQQLTAPGDTAVVLHASAPEGLFFAFDRARTSVHTRRMLLTALANFAEAYRTAIESKNIPPIGDNGLETWRRIRDEAIASEAHGGTDLTLHAVAIRDGSTSRAPAARTEQQRAAQAVPRREDLDFGMDLVDRVVARIKGRPAVQSSEQELGQPNVFPTLAVRAGGHVWEREIPYEDADVAQAAAGRALDEWPDADLVAFLLDAAIRENGVRTDILSVQIENRAGEAIDLFQRYTTGPSGEIELVGNPTASTTGGFLRPSPPTVDSPLDPVLESLAAQALDEIAKRLTAGGRDESDARRPDDPIMTPSALLGHAGSSPTLVRFALQGPLTAAMSCGELLRTKPADWVVYFLDDVMWKDGEPDRRLRLCVQRRQDTATAVFDARYEQPVLGRPFALRGDLEFKRWVGSFFP